ncbi:MAG TPA: DUF2333 family protein [Candidatus Limnocylindria bacterium]|nr:DUF2333 family protein [Candidatus Limnocylindria bacterium]
MANVRASKRGAVLPAALLGTAILAILAGPLVLHFAQKRHDRLPFDVAAAFPADTEVVPGEVFAGTLAALVRRELDSPTGWRPNDFVLWGPAIMADNNANRQLGIIMAARESARVLRDHLTKVSSTEFDPNLTTASTALQNDPTKFWFPSAENRFRAGVEALDRYVAGLRSNPPTSKPIQDRNIELIRLIQLWSDLLGDAHGALYKDVEPDGSSVRPWRTDDYFYHAQGMAHVIYHLTLAVQREYAEALAGRAAIDRLLTEVAAALGRAAVLKPIMVLNGRTDGVFANHRRNLDGYIVEARQKLYSVREELEK